MKKQTNRPQLRFPKFEGEWEKKNLGEVATNKSGKYNPEKETESVKCIELEHLSSESSQLLGYIDGKNSGSIKNKFDYGDVLFGKLRPYLKKYLLAPFEGVCSSEIWVIKGQKISNDFLFRIIQTDTFIDLANQSSGSKMPRADWSVVENGIFSFPTLPEQTKIASFLTTIDEKLQTLKKKKSLLENYKKGVMQKLFSQELRFKDVNGNEFPDWEVKKLGEVCEIKKGEQLNKVELTENGTYPCLNGGINFSGYTEKFNSEENTITISEGGNSCGYINFMTSKFWLGGHCYKIVLSDKIEKVYLYQLLKFNEKKIMELRVGSGLPNIQQKDLRNFEFVICNSIKEQNVITNFLSAIDEKINTVQQQIEKTQAWKKGLLQQMFV